ncbi:MAG TPA: hypothetical protein VFH48_18650 [Chloroflexota bacterium]|nr:hypothetical protein [Chloroflexota bacterium]
MNTTVSLASIQAAVARAIAEQLHDRGRVERGAALLAIGAVEYMDGFEYRVRSQTGNGDAYTVTPNGCTCVDSARHPEQACKHNLAVRILLQAQIDERRADEQRRRALASTDAVALAYARRIGWAV